MQSYIKVENQILYSPILKEDCLTVDFYGCNFKCPYCNTAPFTEFDKENLVNIKDVKTFINQNYYEAGVVLFTGGEPCLQRQALINLARFCKRLKLKVAVHTNASKPETIKSLISENLVDYIIIDMKCPLEAEVFEKVTKSKTFFQSIEQTIEDIKKTLNLVKNKEIKLFFVTVVVPGLIFRKEDILKIANIIKDYDSEWILESFKPGENILDKRFVHLDIPRKKFRENLSNTCLKKFPQLDIKVI